MTTTNTRTVEAFEARIVGMLNSNVDPIVAEAAWKYGMTWYADANKYAQTLADRHGITLAQAAGVLAATSIRTRWDNNLRDAALACAGLLNKGLRIRIDKSANILAGDGSVEAVEQELRGPKITAFMHNILDPQGMRVTIDVWMCRALGIEHKEAKGKTYDAAQQAFVNVAERLNIPAPTLQAVVWVLIRGKAE